MKNTLRLQGRELETIINVNASEAVAHIYTRIPKHYRHFERLGIKPTQIHKDSEGKEFGWDFEIPANWVRMPKGKAKRVLSEEQKTRLRDNLRKARLALKPQ